MLYLPIMVPLRHRLAGFALAVVCLWSMAAGAEPRHGFSLLGALRYPAGFAHFDYVNPAAPKGGRLRLSRIGGFDSTNTLRYPGNTPAELRTMVYDRLLVQAEDEPASHYGLLAETVDVSDDLSRVAFRLRPEARWHDGAPVTARDVAFTFDTLKEQGAPFYRQSYRAITVEAPDDRTVVFTSATAGDRELVGLVGAMPVHPVHVWRDGAAQTATLAPPVGSGPYRVARIDAGRTVVLERVEDYWGRDLPVNRGRWNFGTVTFDYYRDDGVALQALIADRIDLRVEDDATRWLTAYDSPPLRDGRIRRTVQRLPGPGAVTGLVFNLRQPRFQDPRVREAVALAYDFERANQLLFGGLYGRVDSLYGGGGPGASPPDERRAALRRAAALLDEAGFPVRDGRRVDAGNGEPFTIEVAYLDHTLVRVLGLFEAELARLGIALAYPSLEPSAARSRLLDHRFDMAALSWSPSRLPGRAERLLWGSALADRPGSYALAGARDPALDAAIDAMLSARSPHAVTDAAHRFDNVLTARRYMVPFWRTNARWIAHWDRFGHPETDTATPPLETWWRRPEGTAVPGG